MPGLLELTPEQRALLLGASPNVQQTMAPITPPMTGYYEAAARTGLLGGGPKQGFWGKVGDVLGAAGGLADQGGGQGFAPSAGIGQAPGGGSQFSPMQVDAPAPFAGGMGGGPAMEFMPPSGPQMDPGGGAPPAGPTPFQPSQPPAPQPAVQTTMPQSPPPYIREPAGLLAGGAAPAPTSGLNDGKESFLSRLAGIPGRVLGGYQGLLGGEDDPRITDELMNKRIARRQRARAGWTILSTVGNPNVSPLAAVAYGALAGGQYGDQLREQAVSMQAQQAYREKLQQLAASGELSVPVLRQLLIETMSSPDPEVRKMTGGIAEIMTAMVAQQNRASDIVAGREKVRGPDGKTYWAWQDKRDGSWHRTDQLAGDDTDVQLDDVVGAGGRLERHPVNTKTGIDVITGRIARPWREPKTNGARYGQPKSFFDPYHQNRDGTVGANVLAVFDKEAGVYINTQTRQPIGEDATAALTARQMQGVQMLRATGNQLDNAKPMSLLATKFVLNAGEDITNLTAAAGYARLSDDDKQTVVVARDFVDGMIDLMNVSRPTNTFQMRLLLSVSPQTNDGPRQLAQKALLRHTIMEGNLLSAINSLQKVNPELAAQARKLVGHATPNAAAANPFVGE